MLVIFRKTPSKKLPPSLFNSHLHATSLRFLPLSFSFHLPSNLRGITVSTPLMAALSMPCSSPSLFSEPNSNTNSLFAPPSPPQQNVENALSGGGGGGQDEESPPPPISTSPFPQIPNPDLQSPSPAPAPALLHLSFNQDHGCFAAGTESGFRIYNCDPFREIFRRDFDRGGGVGAVEMLFRCNLLALVGGGPEPQYPPNKVMIWDDHQSRCIGELSFRSEVRAVRLRRDRIVVVLEQRVFVYNFADLKLMYQIETLPNRKGLCAVSQAAGAFVVVCPGTQKGQVRVENYSSKRTKFIAAHDSRIACFALTPDGQLLATASSKGTLVRIFNTADGLLLRELRRGADRAEIYSLAFSSSAEWLAVSSDKGTVHVFSLKISPESPGNDHSRTISDPNLSPSTSSSLSFIRGVLPKYFNSEWSVAQFHLHEGSQYVVAFGHQKNTVVILGMDGSFYRCQFDPVNGGEMTQLEFYNFLKPEETF